MALLRNFVFIVKYALVAIVLLLSFHNEYTNALMCGVRYTLTVRKGDVSHKHDEKLRIVTCKGENQSCGISTQEVRQDISGLNGTAFSQFCVNSTYCSNFFEYGKREMEKHNFTLWSAQGSCCDEDLCNINKTISEPTTPIPTTAGPLQPTQRAPSAKEKLESLTMIFKNMKKNEWTLGVLKNFKSTIAELAAKYCKENKNKCGIQESQRKRRAVNDPDFNNNRVHLLPGYPKQNGTDLLIAFYVQNPTGSSSSALPATVLILIAQNGTVTIEQAIGNKKIGRISRYSDGTTASTSATTTTAALTTKLSENLKWIVICVFICLQSHVTTLFLF